MFFLNFREVLKRYKSQMACTALIEGGVRREADRGKEMVSFSPKDNRMVKILCAQLPNVRRWVF